MGNWKGRHPRTPTPAHDDRARIESCVVRRTAPVRNKLREPHHRRPRVDGATSCAGTFTTRQSAAVDHLDGDDKQRFKVR
jgi:hypothetical protein